jgi:hypothetical protein
MIDETRATMSYREHCTRCPFVNREWDTQITGLSTDGTGWTLAKFKEFIEDLLRIRPPERNGMRRNDNVEGISE